MFFKRSSSKPVETPVSAPKRYQEISHSQTSHAQTSRGNSPYRPLRQDADSIRLIKIRPARSDTDPIVCDLTEVTIQDRPCYEALSYTWGDSSVKKTISLNGTKFSVGANLWDALIYLRRRSGGGYLWVDAICINQEDIPERNKQLPFMSQIYFRASTVVVWLGQNYAKHQLALSKTRTTSERTAIERQMGRELAQDPYWNRLWIVQEVGRASKLQVCYGSQALAWDDFIKFMKSHSAPDQGPLKLARQVDRKYIGSHRLRDLLYTHQHALCKDPRDKIYGLVGLAHDGANFPIDYNKSTVEVWSDTMEFMNQQGMFDRESDIISFGNLVKSLLMGTAPTQQALRFFAAQRADLPPIEESRRTNNPKVFHLRGVAVGQLATVGPTLRDALYHTAKVDEWNKNVWRNFGSDLDKARQEGDMLLSTIFSARGKSLETLSFDQTSRVKWADNPQALRSMATAHPPLPADKKCQSQVRKTTSSANRGEVTLFQMNRASQHTPWRMGLTSSQAREKDVVFWVPGTKKALLLRHKVSTTREGLRSFLQVCGTAMVTQDVLKETANHETRLKSFRSDAELSIRVDAGMIFELLDDAC